MKQYLEKLPSTEETAGGFDDVLKAIRDSPNVGPKSLLLPTPRSTHTELDSMNGLTEGALVSVVPDDTGRDE